MVRSLTDYLLIQHRANHTASALRQIVRKRGLNVAILANRQALGRSAYLRLVTTW